MFRSNFLRFALLASVVATALLVSEAHAASAAGTSIGNQATVACSDDPSVTRSVTSNTEVTIVQ